MSISGMETLMFCVCFVQGDAEFKQKQKEQQKALEEAKAKAAGKGPIGKFSDYISFIPENARLT